MPQDQIITLVSLVLGSLCVAFIALYSLAWITARRERADVVVLENSEDEIVFLFDDEKLVNSTEGADHVLSAAADVGSDWSRLLSVLIGKFPNLQQEMSELADRGRMAIESRDRTAILRCEWRNGLARLNLIDQDAIGAHVDFDRHAILAMEQELDTLRTTTKNVPFLVWREATDGGINWANSAYIEMADAESSDNSIPSWPPIALFETTLLATSKDGDIRRLEIKSNDGNSKIFEVARRSVKDGFLYSAISISRTIQAEQTLREFTQTLTKTFSHLTVGLAVFDRERRLALFNPALTDLTTLPPDFLISRPALTSFLDRLRDKKMMPEPKDYKSWRDEIAELEIAAVDGTYEETWSLPGGVTYRVSGRPHPDGAIAFLFEDISAEMSLTRRFRAEIETAQSVFDSLPEAIAVFSNEGVLMMTNTAYNSLWGHETMGLLSEVTIAEATRVWHAKCAPTNIWTNLRDLVGGVNERADWTGTTRLWDGRRLNCRFVPMPSGQTLVGFSPSQVEHQLQPQLRPQASPQFVEL